MLTLSFTVLPIGIWIGLLLFRGQFWRTDQQLPDVVPELPIWPSVCAVIPARNEAEVLPISLRSLLQQNYPGSFKILLVDDQSTDQTAEIARQVATSVQAHDRLDVLSGQPLPPGWTGKLWAMEQGTRAALALPQRPDYILLSDADIEHDVHNLQRLVAKAEADNLELVSLMVRLRCQSLWERFLIPAFVFFFAQLYPFRWANAPQNSTAAAAGGCILLKRQALERTGGLHVLKNALIDDCTLAHVIKSSRPDRSTGIWLGLTRSTVSLRPYESLSTIWNMVARTAFTQLRYSPWLLIGTVLAMMMIYLIAPVSTLIGSLTGQWSIAIAGFIGWLLMAVAYLPMIRFYNLSPLWAFSLPAIACLYTLMTIDSALRHWQGQGGAWKGRVYPSSSS
jgi:hopene-associated glycosyltransferase HpnB